MLLVDSKNKIATIYTPKAACTYACKWSYIQAGFIDELYPFKNDDMFWVHNFTSEYIQTADYKKNLIEFEGDPNAFKTIQFTRNPFTRALSIFAHSIKHSHILYDINDIGCMSFEDFTKYLYKQIKINKAEVDVHLKPQYENPNSEYIIHIEDCPNNLNALEQLLGIKNVDKKLISQSHHHSKYTNTSVDGHTKYSFSNDQSVLLNTINNMYTPTAIHYIQKTYFEDFMKFGYSLDFTY